MRPGQIHHLRIVWRVDMTIKQVDMMHKRYGLLTVFTDAGQLKNGQYQYLTLCDCGTYKVIAGSSMRTGATKSCGCLRSKMVAQKNYKHGKSLTSRYRSIQARQTGLKRKKRTPMWADVDAIKKFYREKPEGYHVDHVIPLNGKLVSGLHVLENLQYLPAKENNLKNNHYEVQ
jgi:hypothetical protein